MIYRINNTNKLDKQIMDLLGESLSKESSFKSIGSCLYRLIDIKVANEQTDLNLSTNVRCNFELFQKGVLLRMNDMQKLFVLPLSDQQNIKLVLTKGAKRVRLTFYAELIKILGVKREFLERFWIFRRRTYLERLTLEIITDNEVLKLDSQGQNYNDSVDFFSKSVLSKRLSTLC